MTEESLNNQRRALLQVVAMAALTQPAASNAGEALKPTASGMPGDFNFLGGEWLIKNRRLKNKQWDSFDGYASVSTLLGGIASVEELRIPARNFSGMGLRLLDVERRLWADYWLNGQDGRLNPPSWGSFSGGVGTWDSNDADGATPIIVRGVWDQIAAHSCRWYQAVSRDGGMTWEENWIMHWTRVRT